MTQTTANKIAAGLSEALDVARGKDTGATMHAAQTTQRVLLLESYCEDNANCTDALPSNLLPNCSVLKRKNLPNAPNLPS